MPLRFGYKASAEQFGPNELLEFGGAGRGGRIRLGLHLGPPAALAARGRARPRVGAVARRARARARRKVLIGTSVLTPTFRYNPTVVAQDFATLGVMYPKRVILGVGTGEALNEANLGIAWPDPPERFQRLKEAIELIDCCGRTSG